MLYDYSGNFSNVREYEFRANATCDFIVDVDSKITWWSRGQIESEVQIYHELPGNQYGCQANSTDVHPYERDTMIKIGKAHNNTCMVKYFMKNLNEHHHVKIQIYKDGDFARYLKISALTIFASVALLFGSVI